MVLIMETNPVYGLSHSDDSESDADLDGIPEPNDDVAGENCNYYSIRWINWNQKLKSKTKNQFFLLMTFDFIIHFNERKLTVTLLFSRPPYVFKEYKKVVKISFTLAKNILVFGF